MMEPKDHMERVLRDREAYRRQQDAKQTEYNISFPQPAETAMREFETGATRNRDDESFDYEGFLSPLALQRYDEWIDTERARAWAAGLFEGEGCITTNTSKGRVRKDGTGGERRYTYPVLTMSLTDEDTIRKFALIVGGHVRGPYQPKANNRRPLWYWTARGEDGRKVAEILLPYLGTRRSARLVEVYGIKQYAVMAGISPLAVEAYGSYMHTHRKQADGSIRDSDNWQKGIPSSSYVKSLIRHVMDVWLHHRGWGNQARETEEEALCAIIFNAQGKLHELVKAGR